MNFHNQKSNHTQITETNLYEKKEILRLVKLCLHKSLKIIKVEKIRVLKGSPLNRSVNLQEIMYRKRTTTKIGRRTDYLLYNNIIKLNLCKSIIALQKGGIKF